MKFYKKNTEKSLNLTISKISMLLGAFFMGFVGILVDLLSEFPIYTIVFFRGLFGICFLSIVVLLTHAYSIKFIRESIKLHWKELLSIGICYPLVRYFYFWNITISGYAIAAFLLRLSGPILLILLFITKEDKKNISKTIIFSYLLAICGVIIIMEVWNGFIFLFTIIIGLISAFTFALHTFFKKKVYNKRKKYEFDEIIQGNVDLLLASWNCLTLIFFFFSFWIL